MSSQQGKLLRKLARVAAGKRATIDVLGVKYDLVGVRWGGVSPIVVLRDPSGNAIARSAADWKRLGAKL